MLPASPFQRGWFLLQGVDYLTHTVGLHDTIFPTRWEDADYFTHTIIQRIRNIIASKKFPCVIKTHGNFY